MIKKIWWVLWSKHGAYGIIDGGIIINKFSRLISMRSLAHEKIP